MGEDTRMNEDEKRDLALSKGVLIILAVLGIAAIIWVAWIIPARENKKIRTFDACVSGGNEVQDSYPEVCVTDDGRRFVNPDHDPKNAN